MLSFQAIEVLTTYLAVAALLLFEDGLQLFGLARNDLLVLFQTLLELEGGLLLGGKALKKNGLLLLLLLDRKRNLPLGFFQLVFGVLDLELKLLDQVFFVL